MIHSRSDIWGWNQLERNFTLVCQVVWRSFSTPKGEKKPKEMIIDFRRNKNTLTPALINNEEIERVESYKYLGVTLDNVLNWNPHFMTLLKKLNTRLYFLRKLNSFHVDKTLLWTFYKAVAESVICFALICWGGNSNRFLTNKIDLNIYKCNRLCQVNDLFTSFNVLYLCKCQSKIISILKDNTHPLSNLVGFSGRSGKPLIIKCRLERYRNAFLPRAVKFL